MEKNLILIVFLFAATWQFSECGRSAGGPPAGWSVLFDQTSRREYFVRNSDGFKTWELPVEDLTKSSLLDEDAADNEPSDPFAGQLELDEEASQSQQAASSADYEQQYLDDYDYGDDDAQYYQEMEGMEEAFEAYGDEDYYYQDVYADYQEADPATVRQGFHGNYYEGYSDEDGAWMDEEYVEGDMQPQRELYEEFGDSDLDDIPVVTDTTGVHTIRVQGYESPEPPLAAATTSTTAAEEQEDMPSTPTQTFADLSPEQVPLADEESSSFFEEAEAQVQAAVQEEPPTPTAGSEFDEEIKAMHEELMDSINGAGEEEESAPPAPPAVEEPPSVEEVSTTAPVSVVPEKAKPISAVAAAPAKSACAPKGNFLDRACSFLFATESRTTYSVIAGAILFKVVPILAGKLPAIEWSQVTDFKPLASKADREVPVKVAPVRSRWVRLP